MIVQKSHDNTICLIGALLSIRFVCGCGQVKQDSQRSEVTNSFAGKLPVYPAMRGNNPATNLSRDAGSVSPSPWGEGRDEGGCITDFPPVLASLQPLTQFRRISRTVENRNDGKDIILDCKIKAVRLESFQADSLCPTSNLAKDFRLGLRTLQGLDDFLGKFFSKAWNLVLVPYDGLEEFKFRFGPEAKLEIHHQPKRSRISALTCSHGIPLWGFFSKSARRRSSSAVCSGVKSGFPHPSSSPYSSKTRSTNARFSSVGIGRICSMSSVALMSSIYPVVGRAQLKISHSSFVLHPSVWS